MCTGGGGCTWSNCAVHAHSSSVTHLPHKDADSQQMRRWLLRAAPQHIRHLPGRCVKAAVEVQGTRVQQLRLGKLPGVAPEGLKNPVRVPAGGGPVAKVALRIGITPWYCQNASHQLYSSLQAPQAPHAHTCNFASHLITLLHYTPSNIHITRKRDPPSDPPHSLRKCRRWRLPALPGICPQ